MKRCLFLTILVFAITAIATAKGQMDKVTITTLSGQTIDLTDPRLISPISMAALEKFPQNISRPPVLGKGYELARAFKTGNTYRIFDRVKYFPAGKRGFVFYVGIENGSSEYDGKWFEATELGVETMNQIIGSIRFPVSLRQISVLE